MPSIEKVQVDRLVPAEWNYKLAGTPEAIERLRRSIEQDHSAGVMAVRELKDGTLEVIDGNHRLAAIKTIGWKEAYVENFGPISKAKAVTVARRRNFQWFSDDLGQLAELYRDVVIPETPLSELDRFMPEGGEAIEDLINSLDFDWNTQHDDGKKEDDGAVRVSFKLDTPEELSVWATFKSASEKLGAVGDKAAVLMAARAAIAIESQQ